MCKVVQCLQPSVRAVLLKVAGGEGIPPEFVRVVLAGCLKVGALNATVFTIPSKTEIYITVRVDTSHHLRMNFIFSWWGGRAAKREPQSCSLPKSLFSDQNICTV